MDKLPTFVVFFLVEVEEFLVPPKGGIWKSDTSKIKVEQSQSNMQAIYFTDLFWILFNDEHNCTILI